MTEVPEMFGAETILMSRCQDEDTFDRTVHLINDFKAYFKKSLLKKPPTVSFKYLGTSLIFLGGATCGCFSLSLAGLRALGAILYHFFRELFSA